MRCYSALKSVVCRRQERENDVEYTVLAALRHQTVLTSVFDIGHVAAEMVSSLELTSMVDDARSADMVTLCTLTSAVDDA